MNLNLRFYNNILDVNGLRENIYETNLYCYENNEYITMNLVGSHVIFRHIFDIENEIQTVYRLKFEIFTDTVIPMIINSTYNTSLNTFEYIMKGEIDGYEYTII